MTIELIAAILFGLALVHTFATKTFERLADRYPRHAGLFHFLGEVEVVFGLWAAVLMIAMALVSGSASALAYAESRTFTEPLFVFVIMVVAASRPVLALIRSAIAALARMVALLPVRSAVVRAWLCMGLVPLLGSAITEPAAMTLAALMLAPTVFRKDVPEPLKYAALGVLFVNVSIGGTLTSFAAPPVLMVAQTWGWDSAFMAATFGWRAALAVIFNASVITFLLAKHIRDDSAPDPAAPVPLAVSLVHLAFLVLVVLFAHHPVIFMGLFLFFVGFTQAYHRHQSPLILREALLVGFFLAGLVVLGGMQQWWLQPIVASLEPGALFFSAVGLTAITDNAALTYLGSLIVGLSDQAKYMLVAGAVAGGGLTIIANAPNPAGAALLRDGFADEQIGLGALFLGALAPTAVAILAFLM